MFWMQNLVIVVISYLISRIIIEEEIHTYLISQLLNKAKKNPEFIVSGILFLSYFFSIFLSNTVVIISFIPIIKAMLDSIEDARKKSLITTNLVLAMIYGANIGGMASLTGSAFNVLYIGFLEINNIPGRENINFFSWFVFGVPLTLVLLLLSKAVLHLGSRNIPYDEVIYANHIKKKPKNFGKQMTFATINIVFMFLLSGLQFMIQPKPVLMKFNIIDLIFLVYLGVFVIYAFIIPTQDIRWRNVFRNLSYFLIFILLFPLIAVIETIREVRQRFRLRGETLTRELDNFLLNVYRKVWQWLHRERKSDIKSRHTQQLVSINRLIYDLPFFGLFFVALVLGIIYLLFKWGDNPATAVNDGHIFVFLKEVLSGLLLSRQTVFTVFLMTVTISIFLSEIINNATVIIIMLPIVLNLTDLINLNPLILLLAVTLGATAVFMSPLGTNINALAFASFERVRLIRMIVKGFLLNLLSLGWITVFLYLMHLLLTKAPILP